MERYPVFIDWKTAYCSNVHTTQNNVQIQCNTSPNPNGIFYRNRKKILKFMWNLKGPRIVKTVLKMKNIIIAVLILLLWL